MQKTQTLIVFGFLEAIFFPWGNGNASTFPQRVHWTNACCPLMRSLHNSNARLSWSVFSFSDSQLEVKCLGNCVTLALPYCNFSEESWLFSQGSPGAKTPSGSATWRVLEGRPFWDLFLLGAKKKANSGVLQCTVKSSSFCQVWLTSSKHWVCIYLIGFSYATERESSCSYIPFLVTYIMLSSQNFVNSWLWVWDLSLFSYLKNSFKVLAAS